MKLTLEMLQKLNACEPGVIWFQQQGTEDVETLIDRAIASNDVDILQFANWGVCRLFDRMQCIRYAVFAARQVLDIFEHEYPEDKRPRQLLEVIEEYLAEPTDENMERIRNAYAVCAVTYAVCAVTYVADAAYYAARADDSLQMWVKILNYGKELLAGKEE